MKLADCLNKHGKIFAPAERDEILAAAKHNVAVGVPETDAAIEAVRDMLDEAKADLQEVTDALPKPQETERRKGTAFLQELKQAGGIDPKEAREIMGDSAMMLNRRLPGISRNGGMSGDALGEWLVDRGYITNAEMDDADRNKTGGSIERAYELVRKALNDEEVVPMRDEYSAMQRRMEEDAKWVEEQAQSAVDETGPDWSTMSDEQKDAHLDTIFGPDTGPAKTPEAESEGARQGEAAARPEVPSERPSLELSSHTEAEVKAKEELAKTGEVEERTAAVRDRNAAVLSPPEGTASPRDVAEQKVPTQQDDLLPPRTADTMSDAIALSSPNGRMSQRAREAANERLRVSLFGEGGLQKPETPQPSERAKLLEHAKRLRELAERGMNTAKYLREAEKAEAQAASLPDDKPAFSRARDAATSNRAIYDAIEPILAKWKNAPEVSIISSMADAPQAVKLTYMRQQEGGAAGEPEAFIYRNKVYLVADSLATPMAALRALLHESVGHFGLRNTFGERLDPILDEVAKSLPTRMKAKAREYGLNLGDATERRQAAEEVLAEMAQSTPQLGVVKKLIAAFRQFLRDIGVRVNLSDNDIIANYILPARGFVERGELTRMVDSPAFSRMSAAIETARGKNYKELATRFVDRLDQALNPLGTLPEQEKYLIRRYEAQGHIEKADEAAKAIRAALPIASESDQQAIFDYLTTAGANSGAIVDPVARRSAEQIKADINRVGDELVAHGLLAEESRAQYRDAYLPRLYLKHLLSESDWRALGAGKKPSDMGYLKARQDIPEDVRKVILGEVRDPGFLAAVAVAKPMRDMALLDWLGDISQNDKWILPDSMVDFTSPLTGKSQKATPFWLKNEAIRLRKQARYYAPEEAQKAEREAKAMDQSADDVLEGAQGTHENYKQIPNTARYGRLRGLLVRSEIYDDMMGVQDFLPTDPGWFQNVFGYGGVGTKATQIWKAMKVSMNPPAQIRNFVSNGIAMQLFAGVPLRLLPARVIQGTREVLDNGKYFQIAKKYGVGASTFATQEVYRMKTELLDLEMKTRGMGPLGRLHRLAGLVMNKAGDFYQTSETIFKTATIIDAMERQGMSEQQAVLLANKALFDYSLVQKSLRYARSAPIGAPFATYAIKVLPRLVETALHHPQRFLPWVGLFYGFPMLAASMLGVNKDDLDKLKMAMPQWLQDKGHALILPYKDEQGRWQVVDLGYFMPWTNWTELAGNVASGELGKAVQGAGIFGGPLTDIITAIKTGKDPFTGKDILAKGDPPERQAVALLNYVWDMAMPPILTDRGLLSPMGLLDKAYGGKLEQAFSGTTNKFGEPRATAAQALLYATGVNVNALTPEYTRATNLQAMQRDMQDVKHQMVQKLYDRSLTEEQRRDIAKEYAAELIRRTDKMKKYMRESAIAPALATQH